MIKKILFAALLVFSYTARCDVYVVVNAASSVNALTEKEVSSLYMGLKHSLPNDGALARVYDQSDVNLRERFFNKINGMKLQQVNAYWARLSFAGQEVPPQMLPNDQAVLEAVRKTPNAVGYTSAAPKSAGVRVVLQLKE